MSNIAMSDIATSSTTSVSSMQQTEVGYCIINMTLAIMHNDLEYTADAFLMLNVSIYTDISDMNTIN